MYLKHIFKSYGENVVFNDFSYDFAENGITVIMGKSGCGKTTLLNIIAGLIQADSGDIDGKIKSSAKSMVFREDRLCMRLSAVKNIKMVCSDTEKIKSSLLSVGLDIESIYRPVSELSAGMARRAAIVRAMLSESDIVILDEPFNGLDKETRRLTAEFVLHERNNRTMICVTHERDDVSLLGGSLLEFTVP